jgi:WD repeat-containing protein 7
MAWNCKLESLHVTVRLLPLRLHVIPGSSAHIHRIAIGEDNLLLFYSDGRARLWDMKSLEFWRSMDVNKAEELVADGRWFDMCVNKALVRFSD